MKTKTIKLYQFDELSESAKEKARDWFRQSIDADFWSECILEDAKNIGLEIKEFDLDRRSYVKAVFLRGAEETAHKIEKEHGDTCETYKTAISYLEERDQRVNSAPKDTDGELEDIGALEDQLDALDVEFLHSLEEDYRIILTKEMEYQYSDESVDENIRINEYDFTETGKREVA